MNLPFQNQTFVYLNLKFNIDISKMYIYDSTVRPVPEFRSLIIQWTSRTDTFGHNLAQRVSRLCLSPFKIFCLQTKSSQDSVPRHHESLSIFRRGMHFQLKRQQQIDCDLSLARPFRTFSQPTTVYHTLLAQFLLQMDRIQTCIDLFLRLGGL